MSQSLLQQPPVGVTTAGVVLVLCSLRRIDAGSELTFDYGEHYWSDGDHVLEPKLAPSAVPPRLRAAAEGDQDGAATTVKCECGTEHDRFAWYDRGEIGDSDRCSRNVCVGYPSEKRRRMKRGPHSTPNSVLLYGVHVPAWARPGP